jgi:hypothetical protein
MDLDWLSGAADVVIDGAAGLLAAALGRAWLSRWSLNIATP